MTQRLYYTDAYCTEFTATVVGLVTYADRPAMLLNQSYFYPTSGGQPFDTGALAGSQVVDVQVGEHGALYHLLAMEPTGIAVGDQVQGQIDWARRYDHMQQHSGQHLLSQVFFQQFGYETVSVHFGGADSTLDLEVAALEPAQIETAERLANELVYANLPIKAYFVTDADLPTIPLRRPPKVTGTIRIVEIAAFDYSACGGTHVRTTAEIGPIKLNKQERRRGQTRLTFLCGHRALRDYRAKHQLLSQLAALYGSDPGEAVALAERTLVQSKELQHAFDALHERLLGYEAQELCQQATTVGAAQVVTHLSTDKDANSLKTLAFQLQQQPNLIALLGSTAGGKFTVVFARSANVDLHMGDLLRTTLAQAGGKGGGRPELAQGGLADGAMAASLLATALQQVHTLLTAHMGR